MEGVIFKMEGVSKFTFERTRDKQNMLIMLTPKATKLLKQGCQGFLAIMLDKN